MFHNSYKESYVSKKKRQPSRRKTEIPGTSILAVGHTQEQTSNGQTIIKPAPQEKLPKDKRKNKTRATGILGNRLGGGVSVHTWADQAHKSMVFALGKDNNLNMRRSEVPGTSRIRIIKTKAVKSESPKEKTKEKEVKEITPILNSKGLTGVIIEFQNTGVSQYEAERANNTGI